MNLINPRMFCEMILIGIMLIGPFYADAAETGAAVKQKSEKTIRVDQETQALVNAWAEEEQLLLMQVAQFESDLQNTNWQQQKNRAYIATIEAKLERLKAKEAEMQRISAGLLPFLDESFQQLNEFVAADFPFQKDVRQQRLEAVKDVLNDYDIGLLAKSRALLDVLIQEVNLGYGVELTETEIIIDERPTQVKLLHVGRVGLYALSMDEKRAFIWEPNDRRFTPLDGGVNAVKRAVQMTQRVRITELTKLPIRQWPADKNPNRRASK